jgi:hypothetical protein
VEKPADQWNVSQYGQFAVVKEVLLPDDAAYDYSLAVLKDYVRRGLAKVKDHVVVDNQARLDLGQFQADP